jgi:hypothetical protein
MTSRPQKNPVTANAEHELARFLQAVDEFECRSDETQFDQMVRNLTTPHDENDRPHVMPVRCDNVTSRPNWSWKATTTLSFCQLQLKDAVTFPLRLARTSRPHSSVPEIADRANSCRWSLSVNR